MDAFIYKLAIIFIPGIMGRLFLARLLFIKDNDKFYFTLTAFLFGVFSYVVFDLFAFAFIPDTLLFSVTAAVFDLASVAPIKVSTIMWVTLVSLILSTILAFLETKRCLTYLFQKSGITNRIPEPDIWSYFLNSQAIRDDRWIFVRDRKNDLLYLGYLTAFSDLAAAPELVLREVTVYKNSSQEPLYEVNLLYLAIEPGRIELESLQKSS